MGEERSSGANNERLESREIRVFISSTFRDMMRERDLLVKQVFPALRRKCGQRFVTLTEVDLRWGITEEQAAEGKVLPLCLAEIERSRPYFLGLLGERYGWIPDTIPADVVEREPWMKEHVEGRKSVTELEILHGVLNNPKMENHAFFYFRDPAYLEDPSLDEKERRELTERDIRADIEAHGPEEAARRTQERRDKLAALKQRIRASGLPLTEDYESPEALAKIVEKQFDELIDRLYPEENVPDPLVQERLAHEAHARHKLFACIDRPAHLAALTAFAEPAEHDGKGLVVTGESGGGKTALLAAWARHWAQTHPDHFLFQHYFGATPDSASPEGFLRRLLGEMKTRFELPDDIPGDPDGLRDALPVWLAQTSGKGRILLVLDGLNQVQGSDPDRHLRFLPRHFPPHVTVLASSLPGPALDALQERDWTEHDLPLATEGEIEEMVGTYLAIHARSLEPALRQDLVTAPGSQNLLFLRTVLEELRQFGSFERLPARVAHYLEAGNPKELFRRVIARWQEDFDGPDREGPNFDLVRRALTHLWAAREGLSEPEWLDLLGDGVRALPRALWTALLLALEPHLSQRAGLFAYGHDFLRQAVEASFFATKDSQQCAHLAVADYFEHHPNQRDMTDRKAAEWPFQLHGAEAWARLEACLTDISLFLALYTDRTNWEMTAYWHPLREEGCDMGSLWLHACSDLDSADHQDEHFIPAQVGAFLLENGLLAAAEPLLTRALEAGDRVLGDEHPRTLGSVNNLAALLGIKGNYAAAQLLYERALEAMERVLGDEHPDTLTSVNNLAHLLESKGDYAGAQPLYERALEASERVLGDEHPDTLTSFNNLARLLFRRGDYASAQPLLTRAVDARERILGDEHPDTLTSISDLAGLLMSKGDYAAAQSLYERALEARERVLGDEHPDTLTSVNNLAGLLVSKGDYAAAQSLYERALEAMERVLGDEHPDTLTSVNNLAGLLVSKGDYAAAQPLLSRALEAREGVLGDEHPDTLTSVNNLAGLLERTGDYAAAQSLYERALAARERVLGDEHPDTLTSVNNLAGLLVSNDDYAGAQPVYERALEGLFRISQAIGRLHPNFHVCVDNYLACLEKNGHEAKQIQQMLSEMGARFGFNLGGGPTPAEQPTPQQLRQLALHFVQQGQHEEAEEILKQLLGSQFEIPGTHIHLARICLLTDRPAEARDHADQAWLHRSDAPPYTVARILWLQLLGVLQEGESPAHLLGKLKHLVQPGEAHMEWAMDQVLDHLQPDLDPDSHALLTALVAAMSDANDLIGLDNFPAWREAGPQPLD